MNTGLEYPEIQKFVREVKDGKYECFNSDVEIIRPEMRFDEVIKKYGYPVVSKETSKMVKEARNAIKKGDRNYYALQKLEGRLIDKFGNKSIYNCEKWNFLIDSPFPIGHQCCDVMKKRPFNKYEKQSGRKPFIGTMAIESRQRKAQWIRFGCNAFEKKKASSQPLSFWTEQDVLEYILNYKVPYASIYGDIKEENGKFCTSGENRTGCIFCMFGCHLEKEPNKFQRLKETHPKQYEYCINGGEYDEEGKWRPSKEGLGLWRVLDYMGVPYE